MNATELLILLVVLAVLVVIIAGALVVIRRGTARSRAEGEVTLPAGRRPVDGGWLAPTPEAAPTTEPEARYGSRRSGVPVIDDPSDEETRVHPVVGSVPEERAAGSGAEVAPDDGSAPAEGPGLWEAESEAIAHLTEEEMRDAVPFEEVREDQLHFDLNGDPHVGSWAEAIKVEPATGGDDLFLSQADLIDESVGDETPVSHDAPVSEKAAVSHDAPAKDTAPTPVIGLRENRDIRLVKDGGWGVGSAAPIGAGEYPLGHPVKGQIEHMRFVSPTDPGYLDAPVDVWFYDEDAARRSGFHRFA
ncbi:sunset domain-containing protein [Kribbia dieselivorans]|uniref:sunset domain-containing protein n=1 Tax=Kribbia dieselivorans TaxID=331526 RepID=UPI0008392DB3|nr:hypothetical protein [Kribbia dieselivorans]